jgi:hypothetical protein
MFRLSSRAQTMAEAEGGGTGGWLVEAAESGDINPS